MVAFNLLSALPPATEAPSADEWNVGIALLVTGAGCVPFSLRMRVLARRYTSATPRRGLVFALLGAGTLVAALGLLVTLFAILTAGAGAALDNWQVVARAGGVTLATGALIAAIYFGRAQVEGWFRRTVPVAAVAAAAVAADARDMPLVAPAGAAPVSEPEGAASVAAPAGADAGQTIEGVRDALLAGTLTRDEAAGRLHGLLAPGV